MDDPTRRDVLKLRGPRQRRWPRCHAYWLSRLAEGGTGEFFEKGPVRIRYEEAGSGFPLLLLPGGGLNATIGFFTGNSPSSTRSRSSRDSMRFITADLRNATAGQSTGPVEVNRPWESHADDQLGLIDHLGIDKLMVMGFCIGGPFIWSLLKRAPNRVVAAVLRPSPWGGSRRCATRSTRAYSGRPRSRH